LLLHILPFIEQNPLYKSTLIPNDTVAPGDGRNGANPTYSQWTPGVQNSKVKVFNCPSDPTEDRNGYTSYAHNGQIFKETYWGNQFSRYPETLRDGTSNTVFFTERLRVATGGSRPNNFWPDWGGIIYYPGLCDAGCQDTGPTTLPVWNYTVTGAAASHDGDFPASGHAGGIHVALGDGSVRFVGQGVSGNSWWAAMTPGLGDILGNDF
jgi:hypothetical protein